MDIDILTTYTQRFADELEYASTGQKTSLPFIIHQIPRAAIVEDGQTFQVMVIGGSHAKVARAHKSHKGIEIKHARTVPLPVLDTKKTFLEFIDKYIDHSSSMLAINFAYPLDPVFDEQLPDGKLLEGTKEHEFKGLMGSFIGKTITRHLAQTAKRTIRVAVANDTICLLLSGLAKHSWSEIAAGVVGTGLNFALFLDADKPVNLEAAAFDKFTISDAASDIDKHSTEPKKSLFEKETSGAYLYKHFNFIAEADGLSVKPLTSTEQLDDLARHSSRTGSRIAQFIIERSAALVACQIAGITQYKRQDMTFVMEGSLFWHGYKYKTNVEQYVSYLAPKYIINFESGKENALLGASKLVA